MRTNFLFCLDHQVAEILSTSDWEETHIGLGGRNLPINVTGVRCILKGRIPLTQPIDEGLYRIQDENGTLLRDDLSLCDWELREEDTIVKLANP